QAVGRPEYTDNFLAIAVPVANHRQVARRAEDRTVHDGCALRVRVAQEELPGAGAINAYRADAVAVPIADDGQIRGRSERRRNVGVARRVAVAKEERRD